ncbi:FKBP-type peptidyl-prolyl cis-trans isomerase [Streptomyces sp. NPDC096033]|uniref:FKBP-type peptidyl-prolyl cis-trans isomerase n=1 Tax=Streptomyces sp. NPDC096033 TaxID=3366071 RepID=UPI00382D6348
MTAVTDDSHGTHQDKHRHARQGAREVGTAVLLLLKPPPASSGEESDASWDRSKPLGFQLGAGRVIAGWAQGVQRMKSESRRPTQAHRPRPSGLWRQGRAGGRTQPGETLMFVCDLVSI